MEVTMKMLAIQSQDQPAKQGGLLLLGAFICGCMNHLFFYDKDWGISYPLFIFLLYLLFYWAVRDRYELRLDASLLMLLPIVLLSLTYAAFSNFLFTVLNALVIPCLIVIHTTWTMRKPIVRWYDGSIMLAVLEQLFVHTMRCVPMPFITVIRGIRQRFRAGHSQQLWRVLAGIVITLPILLLVASLLASADTMFDHIMAKVPELFGRIQAGELIFRMIWIVVVSTMIFAYVWGLLFPLARKDRKREETLRYLEAGDHGDHGDHIDPVPAQPAKSMRIDATITVTMLIMMNAVYVLFAIVQFSYFFGGGIAALPDGVTYAEYARRGFAELVIVTVINFTLLMVTLYGVDRSSRSMDRLLRSLLALLIGCTAVMLCSAWLRLSIYERAYGFSETRLLVHAFMLFLIVLFIIALNKLWNDRTKLMKLYIITAITAYVLINYVQIDVIVASNNIERYEKTGSLDGHYLGSLDYEVAPYLIELKNKHPQLSEANEAIETMKRRLEKPEEPSWLSFNAAEWRAVKLMQVQHNRAHSPDATGVE
jgi:hypothetical protein